MTEKQFKRWEKMMRLGRKIFRCHQLPDRSFSYKGMQFPMCSRCTGLFFGFNLIGPIVTVFTFGNMYLSIAFVFVMCLDGFLQLKGVFESTNFRRFITGSAAGYACFSFVAHIIQMIVLLA